MIRGYESQILEIIQILRGCETNGSGEGRKGETVRDHPTFTTT